MRSYITYEQLDALINFANGDTQSIDLDVANALVSLNATVQGKIIKELTGARKRNHMLTEQLSSRRERLTELYRQGKFDDSHLDSAQVANALLYQLQQLKTWKLTKYKVINILFEMYSSWLYNKKERLFEEHPVATPYGPRFWHAFKQINPNAQVSYNFWKSFAEQRPDIAAYCKNAAQRYYDITDSTLTETFKSSVAYKNAHADTNGGKWNKEMADADIFSWKEKQDAKNKTKK